jgi:hypothetical protein
VSDNAIRKWRRAYEAEGAGGAPSGTAAPPAAEPVAAAPTEPVRAVEGAAVAAVAVDAVDGAAVAAEGAAVAADAAVAVDDAAVAAVAVEGAMAHAFDAAVPGEVGPFAPSGKEVAGTERATATCV